MSMHHRPSLAELRELDLNCRRVAQEACRLDAEHKYDEARTQYEMARILLEDAIRYSDDYERQRRYSDAAASYAKRSHELDLLTSGGAAGHAPAHHGARSMQTPPNATGASHPPAYPTHAHKQHHPHATQPPQGSNPYKPLGAIPTKPPPRPPTSHASSPAPPPGQPHQQQPTVSSGGHQPRPSQGGGRASGASRPRPLHPDFLSFPPSASKTVRASIRIDADGERYDGEVEVPTRALQNFLARRADATTPTHASDNINESNRHEDGTGPNDNGQRNGHQYNEAGTGANTTAPQPQQRRGEQAALRHEPAPMAGPDGTIAGATASFGQEAPRGFDSGVAFRDKNWNDLVRQSQARVGPPQVPLDEKVSLAEQAEQRERQARPANARINAKTEDGRIYSIDGGLETVAYIDPNRTLQQTIRRDAKPLPAPADVKAAVGSPDVLFETTALGAKLRNQHRIGGERVKEMDHFVASVETPVVRVSQKDVAPLVAEMEMKGAEPVTITVASDGGGEDTSVELKVQARYRLDDGSVNDAIVQHAVKFHGLVQTVCRNILGYTGPIQLYYMTTIRANAAVCSVSKHDGKLYFNVLSFQQSQPLDPETGDITHTVRLYTYWVQRAALALSAGSAEWAARPTGLYDKDVRARFNSHLTALGLR
eukprot:m.97051 g.97051  ORF g.97051 m.97051 type:complete len:654 (-) comp10201_c0_seq1:1809-3770(-)